MFAPTTNLTGHRLLITSRSAGLRPGTPRHLVAPECYGDGSPAKVDGGNP